MRVNFWDLYLRAFGRPAFSPVHTALLKVALRGLGFQAWWSPRVTGEDWVLARLAKAVAHPYVLDVGANVGAYAELVLRKAPGARVLALEPNPQTFQVLAERANTLGFEALNVGAGRAPGEGLLYRHAAEPTSPHASMYPGVVNGGGDVLSAPIAVSTLDDIVQQAGIERVHLLKIDTEGSELAVLQGARRLIAEQRVDWVQFEFNTMNVAAKVYLDDFVAALPGYRFYRLLAAGVLPIGQSSWTLPNLFMFQNLLAVRPGAPSP